MAFTNSVADFFYHTGKIWIKTYLNFKSNNLSKANHSSSALETAEN